MDVVLFSKRLEKLIAEEEGNNNDNNLPDDVKDRLRSLYTQILPLCSFLIRKFRSNEDFSGFNMKEDVLKQQLLRAVFDAEDAFDKLIIMVQEKVAFRNYLARHGTQDRGRMFLALFVRMENQLLLNKLCELEGNIGRFKTAHQILDDDDDTDHYKHKAVPAAASSSTYDVSVLEKGKKPRFFGREKELSFILDRLIEGEPRLETISIVGMGGIGKTTLASEAYNSAHVKHYFDCRAWIVMSIYHDIGQYNSIDRQREFLKAVFKYLMPLSGSTTDFLEMERSIYKYLSNKRFLIVLDDVWSHYALEMLRSLIPDDTNGSRILLTTRLEGRQLRYFQLGALSTKDSVEMLLNRVFRDDDDDDDNFPTNDLGHIIEPLTTICGGSPLFILLLGGLLSKKDKMEWSEVEDSLTKIHLSDCPDRDLDILRYFCNDLPHNLKLCLLYFAAFETDMEIYSRQLYQLWIAEGLIPDNSEAVAKDYLQELIDRGFIQPVKRRSDGTVKTLHLNDLISDLATETADREIFFHRYNGINYCAQLKSHRRVSISNDFQSDYEILTREDNPSVRSLLFQTSNEHKYFDNVVVRRISKSLHLLRVLDYGETVLADEFPNGIDSLSLLTYLRLKAPGIKSIPPSICKLINLYTLDMPSSNIQDTSQDIWNMKKLRHLNFASISLPMPDPALDHSSSLQDLNFLSSLCPSSCSRYILSRIPNVRTLQICGDLGYYHSELSTNLCVLTCLESLKLQFRKSNNESPSSTMVLSEFQFPPSLTHLSLSNAQLMEDPMPTLERLPNLRVLKLKKNSYRGRKLVCSKGGFPRLQVLHLKSMQWLEEWTLGAGAMAKLVCLVINPCAYLKRLPDELWNVKSLKNLELWWPHPELTPRLKEMEDLDRYDIQIHPYGL